MADSRRLPHGHEDEAAVRAQQIDALLDEGLDRYFAARYEDAIHLWTRVLFLDRTHAKARAYIERARTALGELQRRSDELLHASRELLERGDADSARRLLAEAAAQADDVQASALRVRLERLETALAHGTHRETEPAIHVPLGTWTWRRVPRLAIAGVALAAVLAGASAVFFFTGDLPGVTNSVVAVPTNAPSRLTVLSSSEVALIRARAAFAGGRLSEAWRELERVSSDSPDRPAADQMRIEIQQLLLASARSASVTPHMESIRR
jgi:hypothetical protein